ncbi:MAG: hypothetical protein BRC25_03545 [Parcubacteria group bacterium SW_6_46_9]|nr:MAG: hypothetical protein BRC25_03545 [Parcubacteria group bacterium SW_6_46_9]
MIDVVLKYGSEQSAETENHYIVGRDGVYLHKENDLLEATVEVDGVAFLEEVEKSATWKLPPITALDAYKVLLFFRRIQALHKSEAVVLLHYSQAAEQYYIHCPEQRVSAGKVDYDLSERFESYQLVGTIHSHSSFSAFHSGVDDDNEEHFDGLHITMGHLSENYFSLSCSLVVNGNRFTFKNYEDVIQGLTEVDWTPTRKLQKRYSSVYPGRTNNPKLVRRGSYPKRQMVSKRKINRGYNDQFWDIELPEEDKASVTFPQDWMNKVSRYSRSQSRKSSKSKARVLKSSRQLRRR